ncbi:lipase/acyltransferase domain-containing protein [Actinacidiphila acididurans]|uniref:Lecithin:cholesterol acyltransferase n=1 Tax=Actinacidiphila acididurans TaxID=2784346 RepID=A0ABS2TXE1_9ACTN|nr:hypothetical protein [Actinacidiphila acididurans]MBM9507161.1 hypothetical protein [Actinacidiphila acididurans]
MGSGGTPGGRRDAGRPWRERPPLHPDITYDAVVVVPGLMGSELRDAADGRLLWGLSPRLLEQVWRDPSALRHLHLTPEERTGNVGRVRATALLRVPAWAPVLQGLEPYGALLRTAGDAVADPRAVLAFPYDWRLPVEHNGSLLAQAARRHLDSWLAAVEADPALRGSLERAPRLVFLAHSMGGLVTWAALEHDPGLVPDVRTAITLGTPFLGSPKAVLVLNGDRRSRLPDRLLQRFQALAATLPGVHDLLPDFRCVDTGLEVVRLDPPTVRALGGDEELAAATITRQARMRSPGAVRVPDHRAVVGIAQETVQSIRMTDAVATGQYESFLAHADGRLRRDAHGIPERRNRQGDGTVHRDAAHTGPARPVYFPVQHGALAGNASVLKYVHAVLTEYDDSTGPPLGQGELGLTVPDEGVTAGEPWTVHVSGRTAPAGVSCVLVDAESGRQVARARLAAHGDGLAATVTAPVPGLFRVVVAAGGIAPLTQLVLARVPENTTG